ncbi:helix-turn-helix domain-containing protein (plasmid) [Enterobacter ludwigii]
MLQTAAGPSAVKPLVYRQCSSMLRPEVRVSLINNKITLNVLIPSQQSDGKDILITGGASSQQGLRDGVVFSVIQEMIQWIESHLDQNLSVERISDKSGYSVWHFQRKFLQLTGLNVYEYVRIRRVINTTFILIRTNKRILDVAVENGFNCQASFTRTIKGITGFTPAVIRRKFRDEENQWIEMIESLINPRLKS